MKNHTSTSIHICTRPISDMIDPVILAMCVATRCGSSTSRTPPPRPGGGEQKGMEIIFLRLHLLYSSHLLHYTNGARPSHRFPWEGRPKQLGLFETSQTLGPKQFTEKKVVREGGQGWLWWIIAFAVPYFLGIISFPRPVFLSST